MCDSAIMHTSKTGQYLSCAAPRDNLPGFEAKHIGRSAVNYCASAIYFHRLTEKPEEIVKRDPARPSSCIMEISATKNIFCKHFPEITNAGFG